jgi:MoxR-like ATPase
LILADEINRAPAKVQSALLEAMAERQITVGGTTYPLPELFMVMATQNPIEQEGTYPLPEAQLDRFLMHVQIGYPDLAAEREILSIVRGEVLGTTLESGAPLAQDMIFAGRRAAIGVHVSEALENYMLQLIFATRAPATYGEDLAGMIAFGASPRGTIALDRCTRVHAWMRGADFATPTDVQAVLHDVLRHRLILTFEAEADGMTKDGLIDLLLQRVPVS